MVSGARSGSPAGREPRIAQNAQPALERFDLLALAVGLPSVSKTASGAFTCISGLSLAASQPPLPHPISLSYPTTPRFLCTRCAFGLSEPRLDRGRKRPR